MVGSIVSLVQGEVCLHNCLLGPHAGWARRKYGMEEVSSRVPPAHPPLQQNTVLREKGCAAGRSWQLLTASRERAGTVSEFCLASCLEGSTSWSKTKGCSTTWVCYSTPGSLFWGKQTCILPCKIS